MGNKGYLAIIGILVLTSAGLGYSYYSYHKEAKAEIASREADFDSSEVEKGKLEVKLERMLIGYDTLQTENTVLLEKIAGQRIEIEGMLSKLKNKDAKVYQLNQQAETLTRIMKSYIHEIDSLNTLNLALQEQVGSLEEGITQRDVKITGLEKDNDDLNELKEQSKGLQTTMMNAVGVRVTNSGNQKEAVRASRVDQIKVCFTILKNMFAAKGTKELVVVIKDSDGNVLKHDGGVKTTTINGAVAPYSESRVIDYPQQMMDICIYYDVLKGAGEIDKGDYTIFVFENGKQIGTTDVSFK